ncbi:hypothetical protein [Asticcacaulis benevestitus]|uniref:Uncharacterized protein n=1 Tax=Asticcacaulis benevestitus DSM 16100 = ATCC BAA-896 TaxID=1121022 RepID=V4P7B3_9CAUL|nr:hypothetical protein [Asticcacaulis benevestitus]ESQ83004.1 hypothetical protein ABENE_20565 [Asticcacaulis benevestitus DSM 16100 = ATCC BAA-896]
MGLHIHSLSELSDKVERDYYIYLLDYGWDEPLSRVLMQNFQMMADLSSRHNAVTIAGTELGHFSNEVFSYHSINGVSGDDVLPAILITNEHPAKFKANADHASDPRDRNKRHRDDMKLVLLPLKKFCKTETDVVNLIQLIFKDIKAEQELGNFKVAREIKAAPFDTAYDALILEPNVMGIGIDIKKILTFLKPNITNS